jgi:hypothetical protein
VKATEATQLALLVKGLCPSQPMEQVTIAAWAMMLEDTDYALAVAAVKRIFKAPRTGEWSRKIELDQILAEVAKVRGELIDQHDAHLDPPAETRDDVAAYQAWLRDARRRVGDGELVPGRLQLTGTDRSGELARVLAGTNVREDVA